MKTYVALLRGINVGGHKLIKMAELREHLSAAGLKEVHTYIQSGNIVFKYMDVPFGELEGIIHKKIKEEYGFEVPTVIFDAKILKALIANNPFLKESEDNPKLTHVIFLSDIPDQAKIEEIRQVDFPGETWELKDHYIYLYTPNGIADAKFSTIYFEKKLGLRATARNWRTVKILAEMAISP